jgi:hypothetical protein
MADGYQSVVFASCVETNRPLGCINVADRAAEQVGLEGCGAGLAWPRPSTLDGHSTAEIRRDPKIDGGALANNLISASTGGRPMSLSHRHHK